VLYQLEGALNTLLQITEKSSNLRKDLKQDIVESVSTLRNIFINLKNSGEEQNKEINRLEGELNKMKEQLRNSRIANLLGHATPSRNGIGQTPEGSLHRQLPPSGGARKIYSEAVCTSTDKRFKLLVKSKSNLSTEAIKTVVKTTINPTAMKGVCVCVCVWRGH
jgi:septal ring factor EnvC (AmiA/AmiB activator)